MTSKFLLIDFDQNQERIEDFSLSINKLFDKEVVSIPLLDIKKDNEIKYFSENFSLAAFSLENFTFNDPSYWSFKKYYTSVFYLFGNYSESCLIKLKMFKDYSPKNLILFPSISDKDTSEEWVFGNVIGMTKWSSSLFKIDDNLMNEIYNNGNSSGGYYTKLNDYRYQLWYAARIGMDVKFLNDLD